MKNMFLWLQYQVSQRGEYKPLDQKQESWFSTWAQNDFPIECCKSKTSSVIEPIMGASKYTLIKTNGNVTKVVHKQCKSITDSTVI